MTEKSNYSKLPKWNQLKPCILCLKKHNQSYSETTKLVWFCLGNSKKSYFNVSTSRTSNSPSHIIKIGLKLFLLYFSKLFLLLTQHAISVFVSYFMSDKVFPNLRTLSKLKRKTPNRKLFGRGGKATGKFASWFNIKNVESGKHVLTFINWMGKYQWKCQFQHNISSHKWTGKRACQRSQRKGAS